MSGLNTLRIMARSSVNPGGVNLGDSYELLHESLTRIGILSEETIGIPIVCGIDLSCCSDLLIELELCSCGGKIQRRVYLSYQSSSVLVFKVME